MIEVANLTKRYKEGKANAVDDITFTVAKVSFL
jgi:ABC-type Na+ transport system ATPase subunit NatA